MEGISKIQEAGRGGSLMVSALPLYSNDLSSNPAGYLICRKDENEWKRRLGLAVGPKHSLLYLEPLNTTWL